MDYFEGNKIDIHESIHPALLFNRRSSKISDCYFFFETIKYIFYRNYFLFKGECYRKIFSYSMVSSLSSILAKIFMNHVMVKTAKPLTFLTCTEIEIIKMYLI